MSKLSNMAPQPRVQPIQSFRPAPVMQNYPQMGNTIKAPEHKRSGTETMAQLARLLRGKLPR